MKKALFMAMVFFFMFSSSIGAATFLDVPKDHWAAEEIGYLSDEGIIAGVPGGKFDKNATVTRGQAAAILVRAKKLSLTNVPNPGFKDVPVSHTFYKEIAAAVHAGWFVKGTEFKPNDALKRIEMAKITKLAFELEGWVPVEWEDINSNDSNTEFVTPLVATGITSGYTTTTFHPSAKVTRAQFAVFTARAMNPEFRLEIASYPRRAADELYYPQFTDPRGEFDFTGFNQYFEAAAADLAQYRDGILNAGNNDPEFGHLYTFEAGYELTRRDRSYISVLVDLYEYTGGAHPYQMLYGINYSVKEGEVISLYDLATKPGAENRILERIAALNKPYSAGFGNPENLDELAENHFYMTNNGFVVFLNPYEYGAYAAGIREFRMPYSMIR